MYGPRWGGPVHRRRRFAGGSDIAPLVTSLGGDAAVPGIYDTRYGITATATLSQWDDARGAAGFGPSFSTLTGAAPLWDAGNKRITPGGGSIATPASALFALNAGFTLAYVGVFSRVLGQYMCAIADAVARTRQLGQRNIGGVSGSMGGSFWTGGAEQIVAGGPDANAVTRYIVIVKCSGVVGSIHIPNATVKTVAITAEAAGANRLTLFDYFPGGGAQASEGSTEAIIAIAKATSATEDDIIRDWAISRHAAQAI